MMNLRHPLQANGFRLRRARRFSFFVAVGFMKPNILLQERSDNFLPRLFLRRISNLDGANPERSQWWLLTMISGRSRANVVRSNEWVLRDSVTSDQRTATQIVESGKARAGAGLCARFNH